VLNENGYIELKQQYDWKKGFIRKLHINKRAISKLNKPILFLGNVLIKCDFMPDSLAIWANKQYLFVLNLFKIASVQPEQELSWSISYSF